MYIFVDESGSFVHATEPEAWSTVVAFALPECQIGKMEALMTALRLEYGAPQEVKLKTMSEARYIRFLRDLSKIGGLAFATAVDLSDQKPALVAFHREQQAAKIVEHLDKMQHATMRDHLEQLSSTMKALPEQLYIQLQAQIELFFRVIARSTLYYVQHRPSAIEFFRWRIDQKNTIPTAYENAFRLLLPAAIQSISMDEPLIQILGADYSYFERFEFAPGSEPTYLSDVYGLPSRPGLNVGKMVREDFKLVDSAMESGVQVADLLASGTRRLLRGGFKREHEVALLLGANMLSTRKGENILQMISLTNTTSVSASSAQILGTLQRAAKPMLA